MIVGRPTVYRGILMRSRLEARVAALLDHLSIAWSYEPRAYKTLSGEYLPDFEVGRHKWLLEAKPWLGPGPDRDRQYEYIDMARRVSYEALGEDKLCVIFSNGLLMMPYGGRGEMMGGYFTVCSGGHCTFSRILRSTCGVCGIEPTRSAAEFLYPTMVP